VKKTRINLSPEINRILGNALLDPGLQRRLLSSDRMTVLADYQVTDAECNVFLASQARTIQELAAECCAMLGQPDETPDLPEIETMCRNYGIKQYPTEMVHATIERLLNAQRIAAPGWPISQAATADMVEDQLVSAAL
jgi:hypothetical protein